VTLSKKVSISFASVMAVTGALSWFSLASVGSLADLAKQGMLRSGRAIDLADQLSIALGQARYDERDVIIY
jgi:hypothetical protein